MNKHWLARIILVLALTVSLFAKAGDGVLAAPRSRQ